MPIFKSFRIVYRAITQFSADGGAQMSAALSYYALFSTAPLLILAVLVAGVFFGEQAARERIRGHMVEVLGPQTDEVIESWMDQANQPRVGRLAGIFGLLTLVLGTTGAFLHVRRCLCQIWRLDPPGGNGWLMTIIDYLLAILTAFFVGVLLFVSLAASTAVGILAKYMHNRLPGGGQLWHWVDIGMSFVLLTLFFAVLYRFLSGRKLSWGYVWYGALIAALLFSVGKTLIGLYLAYTSTASIYGAAGSLVVFLIWMYYSSQIVFFGAELIQARRTA